MVIFLLSFVKGSKSAEGGKNPLADMDPVGPILGGSKSARTPPLDCFRYMLAAVTPCAPL